MKLIGSMIRQRWLLVGNRKGPLISGRRAFSGLPFWRRGRDSKPVYRKVSRFSSWSPCVPIGSSSPVFFYGSCLNCTKTFIMA